MSEYRTDNDSSVGSKYLSLQTYERVIVVQVLVTLFLCINFMMITTFFMKDFFYTTMRYILFANTLVSDCILLIVTNFTLVFYHFHINVSVGLCLIILSVIFLYTVVTPVTLTAMTLERYVAICMPLHHAKLCTTRTSLHCILIIYCLSALPGIVILSICLASASHSFYKQYKTCSVQLVIFHRWQSHIRSAINQVYFLLMFITIVFCYVKIIKVAKAASGENKKSTQRGVRTVSLHAAQLLLCLIHLWCPFIEAAVLGINFTLYAYVRYIDYIMFNLAPRCLSPLVYGLRDKKFNLAMKYYVLCGFVKNK